MNLKDIKQLIKMVSENDLAEIEYEKDGVKLNIKNKQQPAVEMAPIQAIPQLIHSGAAPQALPNNQTPPEQTSTDNSAPNDDNLHKITSPIVGTFYAAPSPESDAYVSVGSKVSPNDTICIIEAMKVMNEIKAEVSGTIEEILVENGQGLEFGQVLFKVKPN